MEQVVIIPLILLCIALAAILDRVGEKWVRNRFANKLRKEAKKEPLIFNTGKKFIKVKIIY
jgi:hypothetical protein